MAENNFALYLEPREQFDRAIIGYDVHTGVIVYDAQTIIHECLKDLSHPDAVEHFEFNVAGSRGENYPNFIWKRESKNGKS